MKEVNPFFDQSIANVYDIAEAPSYVSRPKAKQESCDIEEEQDQDSEVQSEREARRAATRQRMAERGLTIISGDKRL